MIASKVERRYEYLFGEELNERMAERPLAYLPIGILERHGEHLPFGLDAMKAHGVCRRAANVMGGVVLPPQHLAGVHGPWDEDLGKMQRKQREVKDFYLSPPMYMAWILEVLNGLALIGFRAVVVYSGHYPQWQLLFLERAVDAFNESQNRCRGLAIREKDVCGGGDHAGKWETSLMMALDPSLVRLERAKDEHQGRLGFYSGPNPATCASAEIGEQAIASIIDHLGKQIDQMLGTYE